MPQKGGCACGAIRFSINAAPLSTGACHCSNCQKHTGGGPNFVALVAKGALEVTQGAPKLYRDTGDSGGIVERVFCPECGTPLWSIPEHAPFLTIKVGAFDESADLAPAIHIYIASAPNWHRVPLDLPTFEQMPPAEMAPG